MNLTYAFLQYLKALDKIKILVTYDFQVTFFAPHRICVDFAHVPASIALLKN